jgi:hypothetical protein
MIGLALFVWTFEGAMQAIGLAIVLIGFILIALLVLIVRLWDWWDACKKGKMHKPEHFRR